MSQEEEGEERDSGGETERGGEKGAARAHTRGRRSRDGANERKREKDFFFLATCLVLSDRCVRAGSGRETVQDGIEAANGWELERTIERALDALRCPDPESKVNVLSGPA